MYSKLVIFLLVVISSIAVYLTSLQSGNIVEGFFPARGAKLATGVGREGQAATVGYSGNMPFQTVPGTYQSNLSPRFSNVGYGAQINYNMPSMSNLGSPRNPLDGSSVQSLNREMSQVVQENFDYGTNSKNPSVSFQNEQKLLCGDHSSSSVSTNLQSGNVGLSDESNLPAQGMEGGSPSNLVFDRLMTTSSKVGRNYGQSDFIRGDLPIAPCNTGWFQVATNPSIQLNSGAMAVLGGAYNSTANQLANLKMAASGGALTTQGGVNLKAPAFTSVGQLNMSNQQQTGMNGVAGGQSVQVTSFA